MDKNFNSGRLNQDLKAMYSDYFNLVDNLKKDDTQANKAKTTVESFKKAVIDEGVNSNQGAHVRK